MTKILKTTRKILKSKAHALDMTMPVYLDYLMTSRIIVLNNKDWDRFQEILSDKKEPTKELIELMGLEGFKNDN